MKNDEWAFALQNLMEGHAVISATIIRQSGSSPRGKGSRMVINGRQEMSGSIGGGQLEEGIKRSFDQVIQAGVVELREFTLSEKEAEHLEMICGGNVTLLIEPFSPQDTVFLGLLREIIYCKQELLKSWLISHVPNVSEKISPQKALIRVDGKISGHFRPDFRIDNDNLVELKVSREGRSPSVFVEGFNSVNELSDEFHNYFIEPLGQSSKVVIVGAGHISQRLAPLCKQVGFSTYVLDTRPEYLKTERFPGVDRLIALSAHENVYQDLKIDSATYLVIVTSSHASDKKVLAQALQTKAAYIGMIGSRRKIELTFAALREDGFESQLLDKVHAPIGLSIGAETPEEIAISIVAELIQERKKGC